HTTDPDATELRLRCRQAVPLSAMHGYAGAEVYANLQRADELCQHVSDPTASLEVLYALVFLYFTRADRDAAWSTVRRLVKLAPQAGAVACLQSLLILGVVAVWSGDQVTAHSAFGEFLELQSHDPASSEILPGYGVTPIVSVNCHSAYHLWLTGFADEARHRSEQAIATARQLDSPLTLAGALSHASILALMSHAPEAADRLASEAFALAAEHGLEFWRSLAQVVRACARLGDARDVGRAIARTRAAIAAWKGAGTRIFLATAHGLFAGALLGVGRVADGLAVAEAGLTLAEG